MIDYDLALEYVGYKRIFDNIRISFLERYKDFASFLKENKENNTTLVNQELHSLKGITLNLGLKKLYDAINEKNIDEIIDVFEKSYSALLNSSF